MGHAARLIARLVLALASLPALAAQPMIDAHAHYSAPDAAAFSPTEIVAKLDAAGVARLLTTSSPPWLAQSLYRRAPQRIVPLLGVYEADLHTGHWVHDATLPARVMAQLDALLARYPNLWIDTSVRDERIAPGGTLLPEWLALLERHPERFLVAVDTFSVDRWRRYGKVVATIRRWNAPLPEPLRSNLLHDNAVRLFDRFQPRP
ncbi:MAG: hypothetical protein ACK4UX_03290 [Thiobacillus sp.]